GVLIQGALASARAVAGGWWGQLEVLLAAADWFTTFALSVLVIAIVLRYLPRAHVPWRAALAGAVLTAILFLIGRFAFGLYIQFGIASSFQGAAGSFVVVALWAYYVAQILFVGAEFTRAYMGGDANSSPPNQNPPAS
ncbi:MAG: YhjD/YihY/BrkB family envelope integrity protein, partial [bacterium]